MSERLTTPEVDAALNETYEALGVTRAGLAGLREVARSVASLHADARLGAALREALATVTESCALTIHTGPPLSVSIIWPNNRKSYTQQADALAALLAARTPTPETEER
jgi:hypothetical protein